eukprot:GHRQ01021637.1.p5 GENE.GHRQ01021637.1~~GHRQ01021637.1.p5  ORF type:complete len:105 (+),score=33.68 GHRQ01021637.1:998-1312(+)
MQGLGSSYCLLMPCVAFGLYHSTHAPAEVPDFHCITSQQAVWEELRSAAGEYGSRSRDQKQRAFSQLVTPENPAYMHGYADSSSDRDIIVPTLTGEPAAAGLCS